MTDKSFPKSKIKISIISYHIFLGLETIEGLDCLVRNDMVRGHTLNIKQLKLSLSKKQINQ